MTDGRAVGISLSGKMSMFKESLNLGYRTLMILVGTLLLVVFWESSPPFIITYSRSHVQTFFGRQPAGELNPPANSSLVSISGNDVEPNPDLQSESPVNTTVWNSTTNTVNATLDARAFADDTQLVPVNSTAVSESTDAQDDSPRTEGEKYIIPLLSYQVGTGNQLMEYKSAATIARTLNRTLCLIPFFGGPHRHFGQLGNKDSALAVEERYDTEVLSKYTKVASMDECLKKCENRLDVLWRLRNGNPPKWDRWFNNTPKFGIDFTKKFRHWDSTADLEGAMSPLNDEGKCVGLGGIFPGLQWKGAMYAASTYMQHSKRIMKAADVFQKRALGSNDQNYISIHWRFEESNCRGHPLGLCFRRSRDGAISSNGRPSETWNNMTLEGRKQYTKDGISGVFVNQSDVSGAIIDRAAEHGVSNVYLSTDGWLRGPVSVDILKWVVEDVRSKGLNIAGLWMVDGLPNFADGYHAHPQNIAEVFGLDSKENVSNHMIALVEQEVCLRSAVFVGSSQSTWSGTVANTRRGRRCKQDLDELIMGFHLGTPPEVIEQAVIERILTIKSVAGLICKGSSNSTTTKWEDEAPDGWLDYDSCEIRLLKGIGQCKRIST